MDDFDLPPESVPGKRSFLKQDPPRRLPPYPHDGQSGVRQISRQLQHTGHGVRVLLFF